MQEKPKQPIIKKQESYVIENLKNDLDEEEKQPPQIDERFILPSKIKKASRFVVNTRHWKQERETLQYVIDLARWDETTDIGEGNLIWYGLSLRDWDIDIIRSKPRLYFNRYPGSELLARK